MLYLLLSFIWGYDVSGNQQYSDEHLIALVQEYGVIPGSRSDKFDYDALAKEIVQDHPEFTWVQLKPDGTTLHITVKERLPDTAERQKTGSLVAKTSGRITELLVFRGTACVKQGDWVSKGQLLVGGWDYPDRQRSINGTFEPAGVPYMVEAHAVISGEQERRATGVCALAE
jgi:sporulation protein YqfD